MISFIGLRCFLAVAEELNFTRAAKKLFISQQALSHHVAKLEEYYGIKLFDRGTPLTLTDAGRALQRRAREILASADDYAREVQDIKNFRQGDLTVAVTVTRGTVMLPPLLSAFHQLFPQIRLHLVEGMSTGNIMDALYSGTADLCIGYQPENTQGIITTPLFEERFVVLVPNRLLEQYMPGCQLGPGPLPITKFAALPFVIQSPDTMNGQVFQALCIEAAFEPNVVIATQNLITEVSLCMEGMGACVVPQTFVSLSHFFPTQYSTPLFSREGLERLSIFLLEHGKSSCFPISICRLKNKVLTRAGKEFIQLARDIYSGIDRGQAPDPFSFPFSQ